MVLQCHVTSFLSDCRYTCDKNGTISEFCNKQDGFCKCNFGFYGNHCDKGKEAKKNLSSSIEFLKL